MKRPFFVPPSSFILHPSSFRKAGFTLVELLVGMGLVVLLLGGLVVVFGRITGHRDLSEARMRRAELVRGASEAIARDLEGAFVLREYDWASGGTTLREFDLDRSGPSHVLTFAAAAENPGPAEFLLVRWSAEPDAAHPGTRTLQRRVLLAGAADWSAPGESRLMGGLRRLELAPSPDPWPAGTVPSRVAVRLWMVPPAGAPEGTAEVLYERIVRLPAGNP